MRKHFDRVVTDDQAWESLCRFIDGHFRKKKPSGLSITPRFSIPVQPDDDDMILSDYIAQHSPSTVEPTREGNGRVGEDRDTYFVPALTSPSTIAQEEQR